MTAIALIVQANSGPEELDFCLASLYGQRYPEFEILVADVAGGVVNDEVVQHHVKHMPQRLRYIQAPGNRPNVASALNAAVLSTTAEYLVFLGGNCIAQPEFVAAHVAVADYGYFAFAETLPLDEAITDAVDSNALGSGLAFDEAWLKATSPSWHAKHLRGSAMGKIRDWLRKDTADQQYWNSEASSCFREELLAINGFDRDVDDWRLELDVANRLQNNGQEPVDAGPGGNVLRLHGAEAAASGPGGGRLPAKLEPAGEVRAVNGLEELTAEASEG